MRHILYLMLSVFLCNGFISSLYPQIAESARSKRVKERITPQLQGALQKQDFKLGSSIFIRIFKQEKLLELWIEQDDTFSLFKSYPVCYFSGKLGPKVRQGDLQSPEGFYYFRGNQLNPWSRFHLSINIGYPNKYDRTHQRTGSYLMIHGDCVSIGCYAMTDAAIEEIYTLAWHALDSGQPFVRVHVFPFRISEQNLETHNNSPWVNFWKNLKLGYDYFEKHKLPPNIRVKNKQYVIGTN